LAVFVDPCADGGGDGNSDQSFLHCELLKMAMNELKLSARAYDRILKGACTIADLAASERLMSEHVC